MGKAKVSKKATDTASEVSAPISVVMRAGLEVTAPRKALLAAVRQIGAVSDPRGTMPVLAKILIRGSASGLMMAATNLDQYATHATDEWKVTGMGARLLVVKDLINALRTLPGDTVTIRDVDNNVTISAGTVSMRLTSEADRDFPKLPPALGADPELALHTVDGRTFRAMFRAVEHAICQDSTRFHLASVLFQCDGEGEARTVATDGHRLAKCERNLGADAYVTPKAGLLIREGAVTEICKRIADGAVKIGCSGNFFVVQQDCYTLASKLLDAQFPPYEHVIPKGTMRIAGVARAALASALERSAILIGSKASRGARLTLSEGNLVIKSEHPDRGETTESIPAEYAAGAEDFTIGVSPLYLFEAVTGCADDDLVTLAFSGSMEKISGKSGDSMAGRLVASLDPVLVRTRLDATQHEVLRASFLEVVMPMRI